MCSAEESSTQVEIAFSRALEQEDLWHAADLAATDTLVKALVDGDAEVIDRAIADGDRPLLLAISDIHTEFAGARPSPRDCDRSSRCADFLPVEWGGWPGTAPGSCALLRTR